jgi:transcriptional regulator with XRE-family HTH domain
MIKIKLNRLAFEIALSRQNLSQRDFAELIGFSRSHLSHIINGRREPSPGLRRTILEYLPEYTFDDLFIIEENGSHVRTND